MANELELVKIGPLDYAVEFTDKLVDLRDDGTWRGLHGCVTFGEGKIEIEADQSMHLQRATVIHEAIHAILFNAGQSISEDAVIALGLGIYALLKDNPPLVAWLGLLPEVATDA